MRRPFLGHIFADLLRLRIEEIAKARTTKYRRRWRDGKGKLRYEYDRDGKGKRLDRHDEDVAIGHDRLLGDSSNKHYHVGAAFSAGKGKGHYHITAVDEKGNLTIHLDEDESGNPGKPEVMTRAAFREKLRSDHYSEFKKAAQEGMARRQNLYLECVTNGVATQAQTDRAAAEVVRWQKLHKRYLKTSAQEDLHRARGQLLSEAKKHGLDKEGVKKKFGITSLSDKAGEVTPELLDGFRKSLEQERAAANDKKTALAQKRLASSQQRLQVINESLEVAQSTGNVSHAAILQEDKKLTEAEVQTWQRRLGQISPGEDEVQKALSDALLSQIRDQVIEVLKAAAPASGPPYPGLVKRRAKDGHMRWMRANPNEKKEHQPTQAETNGSKGFFSRVADKAKTALGMGPKPDPMPALKAAKSQAAVDSYYTSLKKRTVASLTASEREFVNSVTLFTAGNVASVRNPERYNANLAGSDTYRATFNGFRDKTFVADTSQADYARANKVMTELASRPYGDGPSLMRGIRASGDSLKEFTTEGGVVDIHAFSSWSSDGTVALRFALDPLDGKPGEKSKQHGSKDWHEGECVLMKIEKPTRGTDITGLSRFPTENETVTGGKVRISRVQTVEQEHHGVTRRWHVVTVSHVDEEVEVKKAYGGEQEHKEESTLHLPMRTVTNTETDRYVEEDLDLGVLDLFGSTSDSKEADKPEGSNT